jgi:hypothetical protein
MRLALPLLFAAPFAFVLLASSSSCTTSGTITAEEQGFSPDGAVIPKDAGPTTPFACAFEELDTYSCSGLSVPPPVWTAMCVDQDDCSGRVSNSGTTAGCTRMTTYADATKLSTSCAAWQDAGHTLPVLDSGPLPTCAMTAVSGFTPTWHAPRTKPNFCSATQIASYLACTDAVGSADQAKLCAEWEGTLSTSDQTCLSCLQSNATDSEWSALVLYPGAQVINVAGCVAIAEGKTDGSGCGGLLQADVECESAACYPNCEVGTPAGVTAEVACETQANLAPTGVCSSYATAASCAGTIQESDGGTAAEAACFGLPQGTSDAQFTAVALAFCGPG